MEKVLIIDMNKCVGCGSCMLACSLANYGEFNPRKSRIQIHKNENHSIATPIICEQCEKAPCVETCPTAAIARDPVNELVKIDPDTCIGCGKCIDVCPDCGIVIDYERNIAIICNLCEGDPECAKVCNPIKAIEFIESDEDTLAKKKEFAQRRVNAYKLLIGEN